MRPWFSRSVRAAYSDTLGHALVHARSENDGHRLSSFMFRIETQLLLQVSDAPSASHHEAAGSLRAAGADDAAGTR